LKILEVNTGLDSITLGTESEPVPREGILFTIKVMLEGSVTDLGAYQVGIIFDYPAINCTGAWIPQNDPNFIFYGKSIVRPVAIEKGAVDVGAVLLNPDDAVTKQGEFLLCMINFTANKVGSFTLNFYDKDHTILLNKYGNDIVKFEQMQRNTFTVNVLGAKSPPVAYFTWSPEYPRANKTIDFDASLSYDPDGEILYYLWDFGDNVYNETTVPTITHKYVRNGVYQVNLTVFDNDGKTNSIVQTILIGRPPIVKVELPTPPYLPNEEIVFNASLSYDPDGEILYYLWDFGDNVQNETDVAIITHTYKARGLYTFSLKIFDDDGLFNSTMFIVQIGNPPVANFTYSPKNPEAWETVTFDATKSHPVDPVPITTFVWYFEDIFEPITTEVPIIEHIFNSGDPGFNVTLIVYDSDGFFGSCSTLVPVYAEMPKSDELGVEVIITVVAIIAVIVIAVILKKRSSKEEALEI
jgi:PKD repeat protein